MVLSDVLTDRMLRLGVRLGIYISVCESLWVTETEGREDPDYWQDFWLVFKSSNMLHVICKCVFLLER